MCHVRCGHVIRAQARIKQVISSGTRGWTTNLEKQHFKVVSLLIWAHCWPARSAEDVAERAHFSDVRRGAPGTLLAGRWAHAAPR